MLRLLPFVIFTLLLCSGCALRYAEDVELVEVPLEEGAITGGAGNPERAALSKINIDALPLDMQVTLVRESFGCTNRIVRKELVKSVHLYECDGVIDDDGYTTLCRKKEATPLSDIDTDEELKVLLDDKDSYMFGVGSDYVLYIDERRIVYYTKEVKGLTRNEWVEDCEVRI